MLPTRYKPPTRCKLSLTRCKLLARTYKVHLVGDNLHLVACPRNHESLSSGPKAPFHYTHQLCWNANSNWQKCILTLQNAYCHWQNVSWHWQGPTCTYACHKKMHIVSGCTLEVWDFPTIYNFNFNLQTVRIKLQTVADKMHLVSAYLQDAPCQRQFALCSWFAPCR